jgi:hypothetical protein
LTLTPPDRFTLSVIRRPSSTLLKHASAIALLVGLMFAGLKAQVNIGGTLGFTAAKTSGSTTMTLSSNSTTSTSGTGSFGSSGNGISSVSAGVQRSWTKDATATSWALQSVILTNGGSSSSNSNDVGTFSLTFTPTGGSAITVGTFNFTLDNSNKYTWSLASSTAATYYNVFGGSVSNDNFTNQYYSSFTSNNTTVFYRVFGNNVSSGTYSEATSYTQYVGFQITNIQPIPEPGTYALAGPLVLFGAMGVRKLRRKAKEPAPAG